MIFFCSTSTDLVLTSVLSDLITSGHKFRTHVSWMSPEIQSQKSQSEAVWDACDLSGHPLTHYSFTMNIFWQFSGSPCVFLCSHNHNINNDHHLMTDTFLKLAKIFFKSCTHSFIQILLAEKHITVYLWSDLSKLSSKQEENAQINLNKMISP